jgi:hypothetical protein
MHHISGGSPLLDADEGSNDIKFNPISLWILVMDKASKADDDGCNPLNSLYSTL